jgi:hypothetical protein
MNRTDCLIQKYLDQCAGPAELVELDRMLTADPEAAIAFARAGRLDALLADGLREERAIAAVPFARSASVILSHKPEAPAKGGRGPSLALQACVRPHHARPVRQQRQPGGSPNRWALAGLAAAVLFLAAGAVLIFKPQRGPQTLPVAVRPDLLPGTPPHNWQLEVADDDPATVHFADGARAELEPASAAMFSVALRPADEEGSNTMNPRLAMLLAVTVLAGQVEVHSHGQTFILAPGDSQVFAAQGKPEKVPGLNGKVVAVSADAKTITVESGPPKGGTEPVQTEVKLGEQTKVLYFGFEKGADKPAVGQAVAVLLAKDSPGSVTLVVFGEKEPALTGRVAAVSADGKRLTLEVFSKTKEPEKAEVTLTDKTRLSYSGVDEDGEKPTVGYGARVWLKPGSKDTATEVQFATKKAPTKGDAKAPHLSGKLVEVAEDGKLLTIETAPAKKGDPPAKTAVRVTGETKVIYVGVDKEGEKPTVGYFAQVWLVEGFKLQPQPFAAVAVQFGKPTKVKGEEKPKPEKKEIKPPDGDKKVVTPTPEPPQTKETPKPPPPVGDRDPGPVAAAIDREIEKRLAEAKIAASPAADDAEFLRRVYLDLVGRIPTAEKAVAFLDSKDPDKRARLIDELLASPDYGQHFAEVWRNRLAPRDPANGKAMRDTLTPWLAEQFNRNRGWGEIVHDLLTAEGDINQNPQIGFLLANSEGSQPQADLLAGSAARLFLGVQLQCAQCHDHPFAPWKQADFWGTAAFFSRLRNSGEKGRPMTLSEVMTIDARPAGKKDAGRSLAAAPGAAIVVPESAGTNGGQVVKARFLGGAEAALDDEKPFRPAFAAWVTAKDNPYFARAAVNRLWTHLFGRGLVNPVDNLHANNPASHPALLTQLADEFTASGHDLKHLIRCLCNSKAYQRTSRPLPENETDEPLFSRMAVKVMSPEAFYDSLTVVLGGQGGPSKPGGKVVPPTPVGGKGLSLEPRQQFVNFFSTPSDGDAAGTFSHGIPQFLRRMNAEPFNRGAPVIDQLIKSGADRDQVIERLYLATLTRRPSAKEVELMTTYLGRRSDTAQGYAGVLWILLNSSEFVLNH